MWIERVAVVNLFYSFTFFCAVVRILDVPEIVTRFCVAIVAIARSTVDRIIGVLIERLLRYGLYEPRLTMLLTTLESTVSCCFVQTADNNLYHDSHSQIICLAPRNTKPSATPSWRNAVGRPASDSVASTCICRAWSMCCKCRR